MKTIIIMLLVIAVNSTAQTGIIPNTVYSIQWFEIDKDNMLVDGQTTTMSKDFCPRKGLSIYLYNITAVEPTLYYFNDITLDVLTDIMRHSYADDIDYNGYFVCDEGEIVHEYHHDLDYYQYDSFDIVYIKTDKSKCHHTCSKIR
jgi:hypothetical protein